MVAPNAGKGKCIAWIREHASHTGGRCLTWPYSKCRGYGNFGHMGKIHYAHRYMCELVNGPPPTPQHEAAHSCGNGHLGCVNPRHVFWRTKSQNTTESWSHRPGTRNLWGRRGRLTPTQVRQIRALKGQKTQAEIASEYGMSEPSVRDIYLGRTYKNVA